MRAAIVKLIVFFALLLAGMAIQSIPNVAHGQESGLQALNPPSLPPAQGYSHVVIAPSGRLVSISGQVAIDSTGAVVGEGDFMAQCVQVFKNLDGALRSAGLTFADVVRTDMFVTDLDHLSDLRECRTRYLPTEGPPTSTLLKVEALVRPELLLEIAVEAVLADVNEVESGHQ
jgi:enamine deaminase RidA (YjgF/YER057c/UK114 family)